MIQWIDGLPYENGVAMNYAALASWAFSLEAGLAQIATAPEGGTARALMARSNRPHALVSDLPRKPPKRAGG